MRVIVVYFHGIPQTVRAVAEKQSVPSRHLVPQIHQAVVTLPIAPGENDGKDLSP
jgi:hypothetical protein